MLFHFQLVVNMGLGTLIRHWYDKSTRLKPVNSLVAETELRRCLGVVDLTFWALGPWWTRAFM